MKSLPPQSLADALCKQDTVTPEDYAAHRLSVSQSLERLKRRERFARKLLTLLAAVYGIGLIVMMLLDRVPREWRQQGWYDPVSLLLGIIFTVAAIGFPILLVLYLLRHLPNWWVASRNRHESLLLQLIEEQRLANARQTLPEVKLNECDPPAE
jgi:hypothetical protein